MNWHERYFRFFKAEGFLIFRNSKGTNKLMEKKKMENIFTHTHQQVSGKVIFPCFFFCSHLRDSGLTVAGETRVACVKFGVDSDKSMLLFALWASACCCWDDVPAVEAVDDDDELEVPCPWMKATSFRDGDCCFDGKKGEKIWKDEKRGKCEKFNLTRKYFSSFSSAWSG